LTEFGAQRRDRRIPPVRGEPVEPCRALPPSRAHGALRQAQGERI